MARVRYIEKADVAPEALPLYEGVEKSIGRVLNPIKATAHSPKLLVDWWKMMMTLINDLDLDAKLPPRESSRLPKAMRKQKDG